MPEAEILLPGYRIVEKLYAGSKTLVYRGIREADQYPVVVKVLRSEYPSFSELVQFRNQYTILRGIADANPNPELLGIVQPYSLESYGNGHALVMEDFGGISLIAYTATLGSREPASSGKLLTDSLFNVPLPIADFWAIALQLADSLNLLYQHRVIHKDLKPANVLINPTTGQVKLIDFSIASLLPRETQTIQSPNILEGTLAYLSPEQTGRMNRGIDYRSDFYSLGVTFYELLTGQLPFQSADPTELIHSHLAKQPTPIHQLNPAVPLVLSELVAKLMAKNAEDRYQSALGLKADLKRCAEQWRQSGTIVPFPLAERDLCDRFLISEKLYGRQTEVKQLLAAFERVAYGRQDKATGNGTNDSSSNPGGSELILVAGFSGIGKTAVIHEVHQPIVRRRGYFIQGKYDQFQRNIPFSAFVQAFRDLMRQVLAESDHQLEQWRTRITQAIGENGRIILEVIPELVHVIGDQPPVPELSGLASQNRFNLVFQKFTHALTSADQPLVLFLDDLQWADAASLKLLQLLLSNTEHLLIIGAYRDNEVDAVHPLMLTLREMGQNGAKINTITLAPLSQIDINQLTADTLHCPVELAQPLTELLYQKTQGNPFFTTQFLKSLHEDGLITFDAAARYWQCDIAQVRALALTDDVVEFMGLQLQRLPIATQQILQLAACIGNQFDLATLAIVSQQSLGETAANLWKALQEGLILPTSEVYKFYQNQALLSQQTALNSTQSQGKASPVITYKFLHDRVQQAAYALIPADQRPATHLKIGQQLLHQSDRQPLEETVFDIVNQLNLGAALLTTLDQRIELSQLNWMAGKKAKLATAYEAAIDYLTTGLHLLPPDSWTSQYDLTLNLSIEAAEAAYLNTDFQQSAALTETILRQAKTLLDQVRVQELKIQFHTAQNQMLQAIDVGLQVLELLGIQLLELAENGEFKVELPDLAKLSTWPEMTDPYQLAALRILLSITPSALQAHPALFPRIVLTAVTLCIQQGHSALAAYAYSWAGSILCAMGAIEVGYQAGELALQLLDRFNANSLKSKVLNMVHGFIWHWKAPLQETLEPLMEGIRSGLETGDIEFASYCGCNYAAHVSAVGQDVEWMWQQQCQTVALLAKLKQQFQLDNTLAWKCLTAKLLGDSSLSSGVEIEETEMLARLQTSTNRNLSVNFSITKLIEQYTFGNYSQAIAHTFLSAEDQATISGLVSVGLYHFYESLTLLGHYADVEPREQARYLERVTMNQARMQQWTYHAPVNYQHKYDLVAAEKARVLNQRAVAMDHYDRALEASRAHKFFQEEAIANELAARFYLEWGKEKVAQAYITSAYYAYSRWGATAKVMALEQQYAALLAPVLQTSPAAPSLANSMQTLTSMHQTLSISSSSNQVADRLNTAALLKAAQTLYGEIHLDQLLSALMRVVIENAGADKAALILSQAGDLEIAAQYLDGAACSLQVCPIEDSQDLPVTVIHYVKRTQETVIAADLETRFSADPYLLEQQPQSWLCTPILNQGRLIGILYLENSVTAGAFTGERIELLKFLCSQAAISLENARLYQQSQQALEDLKQAQLHMIQTEKMSALGNLVAGVAHEINNPVGFLVGNLQPAQAYVQDLFGLLDLYQQAYPDPSPAIQEEIEAIDLDYIREDLPKLLGSMRTGIERIRGISASLRTFSRSDSDRLTRFNLHDGLDSTLVILKHRLKASELRPEIEVVKAYGAIPEIKCYAGQLNQVFMNILANAIDALEESNQGRSFEDIQARPNRITITTALSEDAEQVVIRIQDNGSGLPDVQREKIFDPMFTTKAVGKGTGLGLAIARQIIVEKHNGELAVNSAPDGGAEFLIQIPTSV